MNITVHRAPPREPAPITSATIVLSRLEVLDFLDGVNYILGHSGLTIPDGVFTIYQALKKEGTL